ncbi:MAG: hypothetical protein H8E38_10420 [SAR324 cluster bacterium]|nr:hypothetical protein [SAR324 cluster bacterium]MBL7035572.1 hypothetical protein [SAR324 cluster bacterium]
MADEKPEELVEELPENFASQIARDVMVIFQKQMDPETAAADSSAYIWENAGTPQKVAGFIDATEIWLESQTVGDKFAALSWLGLFNQSVNNEDYDTFIHMMIDSMIMGYYGLEKEDIEFKEKKYSSYTALFGNTMIRMVELNASNGEIAAKLFSILIRNEMKLEEKSKIAEEETGSALIPSDMQELFDDIISYIGERGAFKASAMGGGEEDNPNEHIEVLSERLRATRRFVMQEVINDRALEKRKQLELELENQLASAEEIVMVSPQFTDGMAFFVQEKRFNFKYLAVEKIRMTLQLLGSITGAVYFLIGFMGVWGVNWIDGLVVCVIMLIFVRIIASRKQFQFFYPTDISKELQECSTAFITVMRNMSQEQLEHFLVRQIKLERNQKYLSMVPEYVKYLYAIMPDRKSMMITVDELSELVENSEIEVAKQLRGQ